MDPTRSNVVQNQSQTNLSPTSQQSQSSHLQGRTVSLASAAAGEGRSIEEKCVTIASEYKGALVKGIGQAIPLGSSAKIVEAMCKAMVDGNEAKLRLRLGQVSGKIAVGGTVINSAAEFEKIIQVVFPVLRLQVPEMAIAVMEKMAQRKESQLAAEAGKRQLMCLRPKEGTTTGKQVAFISNNTDLTNKKGWYVKPEGLAINKYWFEGQKLLVKVTYETVKELNFFAFWDGTLGEKSSEMTIQLRIDLKEAEATDGDLKTVEETFVIDLENLRDDSGDFDRPLVTPEELENEAYLAKQESVKVVVE